MPKGMWAAAAYLAPALVALHGISEMMEASTHGSMHLFNLCTSTTYQSNTSASICV